MAKFSHLNEFIEHELAGFVPSPRQHESAERRRPRRSEFSGGCNDAAIWKTAVQLGSDPGQPDACKPQND